jgi:hypothetical protein
MTAKFASVAPMDIFTVPPEVLEAIGVASRAYEDLRDRGRRLHFELDPQRGEVTVALLDDDGNLLSHLLPSAALEIASGATLDWISRST